MKIKLKSSQSLHTALAGQVVSLNFNQYLVTNHIKDDNKNRGVVCLETGALLYKRPETPVKIIKGTFIED